MKIFIDANVLISVLNSEYPVFPYAARFLSLADHRRFKVYTSPICLAIAFYFSEKKSGNARAREKISLLSQNLMISAVDQEVVQKAIANKAVTDLEDGFEYYSAILSGCEAIITEDKSGFYFSDIPVYSCEDFMDVLQNKTLG